MRKSLIGALLCFALSPAIAQSDAASADHAPVVATKGKMVLAANGARLGVVNRVTPDGSVQIIIDGKLTTIPGSTLSVANGELTTSLSKNDVIALH